MRTAVGKAIVKGDATAEQDYGYISMYKVNIKDKLMTYTFEEANEEWLHAVVAHRRKNTFVNIEKTMAEYDVIAGKIADDQTNATLAAYIGGAFGTIGSKRADDICISLLLPEKLNDQYCFRTKKAIDCLCFAESEKIWIKK